MLGLARSLTEDPAMQADLLALQRELFVVGADLATNPRERKKLEAEVSLVTERMVQRLEQRIDDLVEERPLPQVFIVPGANPASAAIDVAQGRDPARRARRRGARARPARGESRRAALPQPAERSAVRARALAGRRGRARQPLAPTVRTTPSITNGSADVPVTVIVRVPVSRVPAQSRVGAPWTSFSVERRDRSPVDGPTAVDRRTWSLRTAGHQAELLPAGEREGELTVSAWASARGSEEGLGPRDRGSRRSMDSADVRDRPEAAQHLQYRSALVPLAIDRDRRGVHTCAPSTPGTATARDAVRRSRADNVARGRRADLVAGSPVIETAPVLVILNQECDVNGNAVSPTGSVSCTASAT